LLFLCSISDKLDTLGLELSYCPNDYIDYFSSRNDPLSIGFFNYYS